LSLNTARVPPPTTTGPPSPGLGCDRVSSAAPALGSPADAMGASSTTPRAEGLVAWMIPSALPKSILNGLRTRIGWKLVVVAAVEVSSSPAVAPGPGGDEAPRV